MSHCKFKQPSLHKGGSCSKDQAAGLLPPINAQVISLTRPRKTHYVKGFNVATSGDIYLPPLSDSNNGIKYMYPDTNAAYKTKMLEHNFLEFPGKFENSQEVVKIAVHFLRQNQWQSSTLALINLMRISRNYPKLLDPHMSLINRSLCSIMKNTRQQIVRTACQIAKELYKTIQYIQKPECDELAAMLLLKSTHKKKDIRSDAQLALMAMVDNLPPTITVQFLVGEHGARHKNPYIRETVSHLLCNIIDKIGTNSLLSNPNLKDIRQKILVTYTKFLTDGKCETRSNARKALKLLMTHADFDTLFNEDVDRKMREKIQKQLISLKYS